MSELLWRMPKPGEPRAVLHDGLTVADVAEVLNRGEDGQVRRLQDLLLLIVGETDRQVLVRVVLAREDGSFVWRVGSARVATGAVRELWNAKGDKR